MLPGLSRMQDTGRELGLVGGIREELGFQAEAPAFAVRRATLSRRAALQEMLDKGYVYQKEIPISFNRKIKIVCANWELLIKDGLWNPDA